MTDAHLRRDSVEELDLSSLLKKISGERFNEWYRERQYRQNIRDGQSYFNEPGSVPDPERHSPSQLLQCQRKMVYRKENAPAEKADPDGIFWFGSRFEEELMFPFLDRAVTSSQTYVQNSIWIDFSVETEVGDLRLKGATDPVIVDAHATPILPTEIKTKSSIGDLEEPNRHHQAQIHAYLVGLSEKFEKELTDAVIIYGSREELDIEVFHIEFDEEFWNGVVLSWATNHTQYRIDSELPPATPEYDWECRFCSYRHRCGKADTPYSDYGTTGLLPDFEKYPRETLVDYLEAHPEETLTPTLADQYPELAEIYGVSNWYCPSCDSSITQEKVESIDNPLCPQCAEKGTISTLRLRSDQPVNQKNVSAQS